MLKKTDVSGVKKKVLILHEMSADEKMKEIARLREKTILDDRSAIKTAREEGKLEGKLEEKDEMIAQLREMGVSEDTIKKLK